MSLDLSKSRSSWWDGQSWQDRSARQTLTRDEVSQLAATISPLASGYFVAMASNETGRSYNQRDEDFNGDGSPRAETYGLFQVGRAELSDYGVGGDVMQLLDPQFSVRAFAIISEGRMRRIMDAAPNASARDHYAYLAWSHNYGIGIVMRSISKYGCDWEAAKARQQTPHFNDRLVPYVERVLDAINGDTGGILTDLFSADSMPPPDDESIDDEFIPADIVATDFGGFVSADGGGSDMVVALLLFAAMLLLGGGL